jgi:hypothetical protein
VFECCCRFASRLMTSERVERLRLMLPASFNLSLKTRDGTRKPHTDNAA